MDGEQNSADFTIGVNGSGCRRVNLGAFFASAIQNALVNRDGASADISIISTNVADGSTAIVTNDTSSITVDL